MANVYPMRWRSHGDELMISKDFHSYGIRLIDGSVNEEGGAPVVSSTPVFIIEVWNDGWRIDNKEPDSRNRLLSRDGKLYQSSSFTIIRIQKVQATTAETAPLFGARATSRWSIDRDHRLIETIPAWRFVGGIEVAIVVEELHAIITYAIAMDQATSDRCCVDAPARSRIPFSPFGNFGHFYSWQYM